MRTRKRKESQRDSEYEDEEEDRHWREEDQGREDDQSAHPSIGWRTVGSSGGLCAPGPPSPPIGTAPELNILSWRAAYEESAISCGTRNCIWLGSSGHGARDFLDHSYHKPN